MDTYEIKADENSFNRNLLFCCDAKNVLPIFHVMHVFICTAFATWGHFYLVIGCPIARMASCSSLSLLNFSSLSVDCRVEHLEYWFTQLSMSFMFILFVKWACAVMFRLYDKKNRNEAWTSCLCFYLLFVFVLSFIRNRTQNNIHLYIWIKFPWIHVQEK